jgi:1,4-alpha-glucan branching enzyme
MESYPCAVLRSAAKEKPTKGKDRVLRQMGRELLLAQSRDWAFLMKTGTAREYAAKRTKDHVLRFTRLYEQLGEENVDNACLENSEWRDNLFADLNWQHHI